MGGGGGGLFDYSVKPGPDLARSRLGLVRLVTRSAKARFSQVGDQVSQVKDQVGQGQGQELDNNRLSTQSSLVSGLWPLSLLSEDSCKM